MTINGVVPPQQVRRTLYIMNSAALPAPASVVLAEIGATAPYLGDSLISAAEKAGGVNVTWAAPAVVGATIVNYDVQFATNATFTTGLINVPGVFGLSTAVPTGLLATDGARYVRVRANYAAAGADALTGAYSAAKLFTVDTGLPGVPVLTTPKGGLIVVTRTPALTSGAVATAARYRFELATSDAFGGTTLITMTSTTPVFAVPNVLGLANGTYFWHASAIDAAGNESAFSTTASFVVNAP